MSDTIDPVRISPRAVAMRCRSGLISIPLTATPDGPGSPTAWASSDPTIAAVDPDGTLTPVNPGTATITATIAGSTGSINVAVADEGDQLVAPDIVPY